MRIVVIGAGKIGAYLARQLRSAKRSVIIIEKNETRARDIAEETGALTVVGDGTDLGLLTELEVRNSDFFLALTGIDEDNLVACQLARTAFGVQRVLARLNDPANRPTFEALELPVVSVTDLLVEVISRELDLGSLVRVALLGRGEVSLLEVETPDEMIPRRVQDLVLPPSSVLVALRREGTVIVPTGESWVEPRDRVLAVTLVDLEDEVRDALTGGISAGSAAGAEPSERQVPLMIEGDNGA